MKVAIVGLGSVGRRHLRNLASLGHTDVVLVRSGRSTLPDAELAAWPVAADLQEALRFRPAAAVIATPTALHLDAAIPLARAGCHLLIEKPVSHTVAGLEDLQQALRVGGGRAMVAFQYRHHPGLLAIRRWILDGAIGRPVSARACYADYLPDWHPWEDYRQSYAAKQDLGGGAVLTLCHPLDYLAWLLGPVTHVTGVVSSNSGLGIDVEDSADGVLECAGGAVASVHMDFVQRPPSHHLTIVGTEGTLAWDQSDGAARLYRVSTGRWEVTPAPAAFDRNDMFLSEMQHFLSLADGTASQPSTLDEGVHALAIALALLESARSGRRVEVAAMAEESS